MIDLPGGADALRDLVRLVLAAVLGGLLGYERQRLGKAAGVRTHMLVSLGAGLYTLATLDAGASIADLTRVIQGVATGIGFVGAGAIVKTEHTVHGLTTAAGIWLAAAVGMAAGAGRLWVAVLGAGLAFVILDVLRQLEATGPAGDAP